MKSTLDSTHPIYLQIKEVKQMSKKVSLKQNIGVTTVCIICITTVFTLLQFIYPQVLSSLRRNPTALYSGQWWRLFTPLLVHSDKNAWVQFIINMLGIAILGTAVERLVGGYKFLILYWVGGLGGEIAGYSGWDPFGAGASVGLCGLLGGLFIFLIKGKSKMTPIIPVISLYFIAGLLGNASGNYVFSILICLLVAVLQMLAMKNKENIKLISFIIGVLGALGGIILIILKDIHGVAIITGSCMALFININSENKVDII